jgi:hypothetical protein
VPVLIGANAGAIAARLSAATRILSLLSEIVRTGSAAKVHIQPDASRTARAGLLQESTAWCLLASKRAC